MTSHVRACVGQRNAQILGFYAKEANIYWGRPMPCSNDRKKLNYSSDTNISVFLVIFFCGKYIPQVRWVYFLSIFVIFFYSSFYSKDSILNFTHPDMAYHKESSTVCFIRKTRSGTVITVPIVEYQKTEVQSSLQRERT